MKSTKSIYLFVLLLILSQISVFSTNREVCSQFKFLPVGEVKPQGWLLNQLQADLQNGFTPILDLLTPETCNLSTFDTASKTDFEIPKIGGVWWNAETTGNWLDGFIRMAYLTNNAKQIKRVDDIVLQIVNMQEADGYLGSYPKSLRYQSPIGIPNNGELWAQACLFRGLLAYYELTGNKSVFNSVKRAIDLTMSMYGKNRPYWPKEIPRGGPPHSLMFVDVCEYMHRISGEKRYVDFAQFLYDSYNDATSVIEADILIKNLIQTNKLFNGHAAHTMEHLRVPLFVYYNTKDDKYKNAVENLFIKTKVHTGVAGACVGDEDIRQQIQSSYISGEHCTMFELLNSLQSGVEKNGNSELADWIELLAFNSAEGARLRDSTQATRGIQYQGFENQYKATHTQLGGRCKYSPTHADVAVCCAPTAGKIFSYLINNIWMKEADGNGLVATIYAPNILKTKIKNTSVLIKTDTNYPFEDEVRMSVQTDKPIVFSIRLRTPAWKGSFAVNVKDAKIRQVNGWQIITKKWKSGDKITISFQPEIVQNKAQNGEIYWKRGPLVYALPIVSTRTSIKQYKIPEFADWDIIPVDSAIWNYGVNKSSGNFEYLQTNSTQQILPWIISPVSLKGCLFNSNTGKQDTVKLVPMGTSLLRRTTFSDLQSVSKLKSIDNLATSAKVEVSSTSTKPEALIDSVAQGYPQNQQSEWVSKKEKAGAHVKLKWDKPIIIEEVWLYDRPNAADQVINAWINFSDGTSELVTQLPNDGSAPFKLNFPEKIITWMEIIVTKVSPTTNSIGFSEIAVFKNVQ